MKSNKKQILILGPCASAETAKVLSPLFDAVIPASIGFFGSGEPFVELFPKQQQAHAANAAILQLAEAVILQSTPAPVGDNFMHLLLMGHTLQTYGAARITAVVPYKAFDRQDRAFKERFTSIASDLAPGLMKAAGIARIITLTPHSQASMAPYKKIYGGDFIALATTDLFADDIRARIGANALTLSVGAPDGADKAGDEGQLRARALASAAFNTAAAPEDGMFFISKVHTDVSETKIEKFDGNVESKDAVLVDDMIDGGSTMINAASRLKARGARSVTAYATHALLSGNALEKILSARPDGQDHAIDRLVVTDSVPDVLQKLEKLKKDHPALAERVTILSAGGLMAQALEKTQAPKIKPLSPPSA